MSTYLPSRKSRIRYRHWPSSDWQGYALGLPMAFSVLSFGKKQTREATAVFCPAFLLCVFASLGRGEFLFQEWLRSRHPECHWVPAGSFWEGDEITEMGNFIESYIFGKWGTKTVDFSRKMIRFSDERKKIKYPLAIHSSFDMSSSMSFWTYMLTFCSVCVCSWANV